MGVKSIYILNKAGGLIFQRDFGDSLSKLDSNDYLVIAGTLHSVHAITTRISPVAGSSGLTVMETPSFSLHIFQSQTGIKFMILTDRQQYGIDSIASRIHHLYSDYVMKNPFYTLEMPIRCEKFDRYLGAYISTVA
ncbi:Transport protein particle subunit trs23 [Wickerhamiella sorbophila]|uniref:Trafficking protein particle complex subunit n=1 Tax=Wickerhamiella sorbophila TaxID=45607 RepID=A0A2T0FCX2_9ASCO|nr:Transport protein particle subunit trs23 [Wickerhamiella sorbophila]PRT52846.1 Transport protein particle subunit trs23 [Wickerhamiella sorbophila]